MGFGDEVRRTQTLAAAKPQDSPEWSLVRRALYEFTGFEHGVVYDVPRAEAPEPVRYGSVYLRGSGAWGRFLAARRQVDDPQLKILLALRPLSDAERLSLIHI